MSDEQENEQEHENLDIWHSTNTVVHAIYNNAIEPEDLKRLRKAIVDASWAEMIGEIIFDRNSIYELALVRDTIQKRIELLDKKYTKELDDIMPY